MKEYVYRRISGSILLIGLAIISGCDRKMTSAPGWLEGKISIGPICPVETIPPSPGCLPTADTYKAYPVSVWTSNGRIKITQINPALSGEYSAELAPGNYKIVLDKNQGGIGASNLPVEISVKPGEKTILDINIDTGIR